MNKTVKRRIESVVWYLAVGILSSVFILPFVWMLSGEGSFEFLIAKTKRETPLSYISYFIKENKRLGSD